MHAPLVARLLSKHASPEGALVSVPPPCEPVAAERVSVGGAVNCAVTLLVLPGVIESVHVDAVHAPEYPEKDDNPDGVAVSDTTVFGGNVVVHVPPVTPFVIVQLIPEGTLIT